MKRFLLLAGLLAVLSGCAQKTTQEPAAQPAEQPQPEPSAQQQQVDTPEETTPLFTEETYPRVDGSTANLPLMAAVRSKTCGISEEEAEALVTCSKTSYAWLSLANDQADLLMVYEPAESTKEELAQTGVALEHTPIGTDALVFIVNENNPVESLTTEQLQKIYMGEITNWSELGGNDQPIVAYQRAEASGSQALFQKLLLGDKTAMQAPTELRPTEMGELIDELAEYNNAGNAIGYSVFYYANYMYSQPGLKFIAVDGVMPSDKTLADASYPFLNPFVAAIRADEKTDSPARRLYEWLQSDAGRETIAAAGYIPIAS